MAGYLRTQLWITVLGGVAGSLWYLVLVFNQTSSTAAIGIIATPVIFVFAAALTGAYSWGVSRILLRPPWHQKDSKAAAVWSWTLWLSALALVGAITVRVSAVGGRVYAFYHLKSDRANSEQLGVAWKRYVGRHDYFVLSAIARNPLTPQKVLLEAASASDPGLHEKRQGSIQLFDRDSLAVVRKVLRNPSMPAEALPFLAQSTNAYVLGDVAGHEQADPQLLRQIYERSSSYLVLWGLGRNPHTPEDILERIAPATLEGSWVLAGNLARNPSTPEHVLEHLAGFEDGHVRSALARNPSLPKSVMFTLATDPDDTVRMLLTTNSGVDLDVVAILAEDPSEKVLRYLDRAYLAIAKSPKTSPATLAKLAANPDRNIRRFAGLSPQIDRALMEQLAVDPDSRVRFYLASNPAVDRDLMQRLAQDHNTSVRTTALATLPQTRSPAQPVPED